MSKKITLSSLLIILFLSGCARNIDSDTYTSSNLTGTVVEGTVISARYVKVKQHDSIQKNTYGGIAGAALLGTAGSTIGGGAGLQISSIAAGVVGSVLGAMVEDKLGNTKGIEYIVKFDANQLIDMRIHDTSYSDNYYNLGNNLYNVNYKQNNNYRNNSKGDMIFVIQRDDSPLKINQRVLVIYERGKARIIAKS